MKHLHIILLTALFAFLVAMPQQGRAQRRITPINTAATATQPINETKNDTARIHARMRATMPHYEEENGVVVYIDTITGTEFRDSTYLMLKKPMEYPLWHSVSVGVDIWNPLMRAFGQHYGLIDFCAQLNLHNRYLPVFETGLGMASNTPADMNFTYKSPLSTYFRIGMDYNFLYNANPDYQFLSGLRLGVAPFKYSVEDITINSSYWDETAHPTIPSQQCTAMWWEFCIGLRVNLWGPISASWMLRYHSIINESKNKYGQPWYIPGYGARGQAITGSVTFTYTINLNKKKKTEIPDHLPGEDPGTIYMPEGYGEPTLDQINQGHDAQTPQN